LSFGLVQWGGRHDSSVVRSSSLIKYSICFLRTIAYGLHAIMTNKQINRSRLRKKGLAWQQSQAWTPQMGDDLLLLLDDNYRDRGGRRCFLAVFRRHSTTAGTRN